MISLFSTCILLANLCETLFFALLLEIVLALEVLGADFLVMLLVVFDISIVLFSINFVMGSMVPYRDLRLIKV